ncbi:hypothetical protein ACPXCP_39180 [Streptomyces sp. DT20]|uniref:hypothetical protein n=1 Tax=Streptomyces sp. DT20 TaxID=3416519 RepID=UPI003CF8F40E
MLMVRPAAAKDGPVSKVTEYACDMSAGHGTIGTIVKLGADAVAGGDACKVVGDKVEKATKEAWDAVWNSVIGDALRSALDVVRWLLKTTLTLSLLGPSLDLADTGLFEREATLSGMLIWLGWVIAAFGAMWQIGKAAVTGQSKYWTELLSGFVQNALLSSIGLTMVATLLRAGDVMTTGIVDLTFHDTKGLDRIIALMVPVALENPAMAAGIILALLLVGFIQIVLTFLRQSVIPIQCMLLPVAGGGLLGGKATQGWAPKLITSICMTIAYKPMVAIIICIGFSEVGRSHSVVEWLRGLATLILAVLAPAPLVKIFSAFGAEVGGSMSAGGALGAAANIGAMAAGSGTSGGSSGGDTDSADPVRQAQNVQQSMGPQGEGEAEGGKGEDALNQAAHTNGESTVPGQGTGPEASLTDGVKTGVDAGLSAGKAAAPGIGLTLQVLDGVNDAVQSAASEMGEGGTK